MTQPRVHTPAMQSRLPAQESSHWIKECDSPYAVRLVVGFDALAQIARARWRTMESMSTCTFMARAR